MPYKGSKSKLADFIIDAIPPANNFVDLFAGGCAVTHRALEAKDKFKRVISNDLLATPDAFDDLLRMDYYSAYELLSRFVTREQFTKFKELRYNFDIVYCLLWSFSGNLRDYVLSYSNEYAAKIFHKAIFNKPYDDTASLREHYNDVRANIVRLRDDGFLTDKYIYKEDRWPVFERIQRLLEFVVGRADEYAIFGRLKTYAVSYDKLEIPAHSVVVYADPPYSYELNDALLGYSDYRRSFYLHKVVFDTKAFEDWCRKANVPVFVSSYRMSEDFIPLRSKSCSVKVDPTNVRRAKEKLFLHKKWLPWYRAQHTDLFNQIPDKA